MIDKIHKTVYYYAVEKYLKYSLNVENKSLKDKKNQ